MAKELYIGVMSGTSMDSIDVALCRVDQNSCELLESYEHPYPHALKIEILEMIRNQKNIAEVGKLDHRLGILFAQAVNALLRRTGIDSRSIEAIGSHGQTLWHDPVGKEPFSIQLGDPNIITAKTKIKVVADFRRKDMALAGNGAPLAPAFHRFIFKNINMKAVIANIGGICNITVLGERLLGYDTGPGNILMDSWTEKHLNKHYDKDGAWARSGKVDYSLLDVMIEDDYFKQDYPKSTGREKFNETWLDEMITRRGRKGDTMSLPDEMEGRHAGLPLQDVQRTLIELTALSLSTEVLKFNPDMLMLCGGGAKNTLLVERITALMPNVQVGIMEEADWIEAMMMAWLAYKRIHEEPVLLKEVTGAEDDTILGGVYL